jgi:hypothetical protein
VTCRATTCPEAGGEPFDLRLDQRRGVPVVAVRHVRVGPQWDDAVDLAVRVGDVCLGDQYERVLGHPPGDDLGLGRRELLEAAGEVQRARSPGRRLVPRHLAAHGEVDLEGRRAVGPGRGAGPLALGQVLTGDAGEPGRGQVEQRDPGPWQVGERAHAYAGHHLAAEVLEQRDERAPDGL